MLKKLAIISTHPIQYNAPLFAMLSSRRKLEVKVFYTWGYEVLEKKYDPGFNRNVEWDIPLLDNYEYVFVENVAKHKGSHHFRGIDNPALINIITQWGAHAVLVYGWSFKSHLKAIRYFSGKIPVFFRGDSTSLNVPKGIISLIRNIFLRWIYHHVDICFYVGTHNKNYFKEQRVKGNQLVFAPHAIDNKRFENDIQSKENQITKWKHDLGIALYDIVLLYAGKLDYNKNILLLAEVFCSLKISGLHLIIAGHGIVEKELKSLYAGKSNIHFLPFQNQSQMPVLYGLCDIFVLPSLSETWGLSINEAMACGKAVLASSACGAATDLVKEGVNGYIFKSNDSNDLKLKLYMLSHHKSELEEMGLKSKEIIGQWNFENSCIAIEELLSNQVQ